MKHTVELSPELQELAEKTEQDLVELSNRMLDVAEKLERLGALYQKTANDAVKARLYSNVAIAIAVVVLGIKR